jgi:hypothetical protein
MLPSTKLRLGAPSQRRAPPPPSPDKENPPRKRPAPVDLSAFAFDRTRRPRAAAAALPAVRARDAARESRGAAAAVLRAVPLLALGQRGLAVAGGVSPVPSSSTKTCKCVPAPLRASPLCARRVAVVTESQLREREASPWTVLTRIAKGRPARPKTH